MGYIYNKSVNLKDTVTVCRMSLPVIFISSFFKLNLFRNSKYFLTFLAGKNKIMMRHLKKRDV